MCILNALTLSVESIISLSGVNEVLVASPYIYATDTIKYRLIKMDMNGTIIAHTGTEGNGPGQFASPNGIRLSKANDLYVCDTLNHRIQVFDKDLHLLRILGNTVSGSICFNMPNDLVFDDAGNIYIVNHKNHAIQVLSPEGKHIRNIGRPGSKPGELQFPGSAAVHRDMIYITDYGNKRISVFKLSGEFVSTFGEGILSHPECLTIDDNGFVYVSDDRSKIVKF